MADAVKSTTSKALAPKEGGLINQDGSVSQGQSKGFVLEHSHEATFNMEAAKQGKPYIAIRMPTNNDSKIEINEKFLQYRQLTL